MELATQEQQKDYIRFFHQYKNLAFHIAHGYTQNDESAEQVVEDVMVTLRQQGILQDSFTRDQQKALLGLIARHRALVAARVSHNGPAHETQRIAPPKLAGDAEVSLLGELLGKVPTRDRIVLILSGLFPFSDEKIAHILRLKKNSVTTRRQRSLDFIATQYGMEEGRQEELVKEAPFQRALSLWMRANLNSIEAAANMDPHVFSPGKEDEILNAMNFGGRDGALGWFSKKKLLLPFVLALLLAAILLIYLLAKSFQVKQSTVEIDTSGALPASETVQASSSRVVVSEQRVVKPAHRAFYDNRILFLDETNGNLYSVEGDNEPQLLLNLFDPMQQAFGVEHIGQQEDIIRLAFIDGRGGRVSGNPLQFMMEPYWETAWFAGQQERPYQDSVIAGDVEFLFTEEEPASEASTDETSETSEGASSASE